MNAVPHPYLLTGESISKVGFDLVVIEIEIKQATKRCSRTNFFVAGRGHGGKGSGTEVRILLSYLTFRLSVDGADKCILHGPTMQ